jgi:DNA-directed RNA polymerase omega subunit
MGKRAVSDESKFRMILVVAARARQLQSGARALVHTAARKATRIAQEEFNAGMLPYEITPDVVLQDSDAAPRKRAVLEAHRVRQNAA